MSDREFQIHAYATWAVSTLSALEILRRNQAPGHAQQLNYVLKKFFNIAKEQFGDDFLEEFHCLFEKAFGLTSEDIDHTAANEETLH